MGKRGRKKPVFYGNVTEGALYSISEEDRNILCLYYGWTEDGKNYTLREICDYMGWGLNKVVLRRKQAEENLQEAIKSDVDEQLSDVEKEAQFEKAILELGKKFPSMGWIPNVAQERPIKDLRNRGNYPFIQVMVFGNGTGKTNFLSFDITGCLLGPEFLPDYWYDGKDGEVVHAQDISYYHDLKGLRDSGELRTRIVCDAEDMKENGSLWAEIKKTLPMAEFKGKSSTGAFKQVVIQHPTRSGVKNVIDVKTFQQDTTSHAGANLTRIWINEPPPYPIFSENVRRTRSLEGELQGTIVIAATALSKATWLFDLDSNEEVGGMKVKIYRGCIYENVIGSEITDALADEILERVGHQLEKSPNGVGYVTRGKLTMQSAKNIINALAKVSPDEVDAIIWGDNVKLQGSIYKSFNSDVHIISERRPAKNYPVIQIVDPHPVKPDFSAWAYITPMDQLIFFHEYPNKDYTTLSSNNLTIPMQVAAWEKIEHDLGFHGQVVDRIGDPNMFMTKNKANNYKPLHMLYSEVNENYNFNMFVNDNLDYGHKQVMEFLYYNADRLARFPNDVTLQPRLQVTENCLNIKNAMKNYGRKINHDPTAPPSEQVDPKYKDAADVVRYAVVCFQSYVSLMSSMSGRSSDYEKILAGSSSSGYNNNTGGYGKSADYQRILNTGAGMYADLGY